MSDPRPLRIIHCFRSPIGGIFRHVRDLAEAHAWWRLAAAQGLREAQRNLILLEREMSPADRERADKLYVQRR